MGLFNAFISRKKFNSTTSHTSVLIVMGSQPYQASYLLNCILLKLPWNGSQWLANVQFKSTIHHNTGTVHTHTTHRGWFTASIYFMKVIKDVPFLHQKKKDQLVCFVDGLLRAWEMLLAFYKRPQGFRDVSGTQMGVLVCKKVCTK